MVIKADKFCRKNIESSCLVIGDIILDKYIYGEVRRISPEAPIPVVNVSSNKYVLGGAANVAGNIRGYHLKVYLAGLLGNDGHADRVQKLLLEKGIEFVGVISTSRCTTLKTRVVGFNQQLIRIDDEMTMGMNEEEEKKILKEISSVFSHVQYVILSDYNKGVCSDSFCRKLFDMCEREKKKVIVDPKSNNWTKYMGAYLITPNFKEFQEVIGHKIKNEENQISQCGKAVMQQYKLDQILVTRSQYGMTLVSKELENLNFQAIQQEVYDVSGAGDTVIATIAAFLTAGYKLQEAVEASNYAAGLAVSKMGTYIVSLEEVIEYINHLGVWYENKIISASKLAEILASWRKTKERIVFTNGCFDILHMGHIDYLNRARMLGSKLIIGLNSDFSIKRIKGNERPINDERARSLLLAALQCVDAVVIFNEDTPEELIKQVQPDFLVKGGDYKVEEIVGRQYAGDVRVLSFLPGYSTTNLIEKIKNM